MYYGVLRLLLVIGVINYLHSRPLLVSVLLLVFFLVRMSLARLTNGCEILQVTLDETKLRKNEFT